MYEAAAKLFTGTIDIQIADLGCEYIFSTLFN